MLGLYDDAGALASVGVIGLFTMARRRELFTELQPLVTTFDDHPWNWAAHIRGGARSAPDRELPVESPEEPVTSSLLRPERVVEVRYERMENGPGGRAKRRGKTPLPAHGTVRNRWRPDRDPRTCGFAQLEQPRSFNLGDIIPGIRRRHDEGDTWPLGRVSHLALPAKADAPAPGYSWLRAFGRSICSRRTSPWPACLA